LLPLVYLFILRVYGLTETVALACVAMAVLVVMPVVIARVLQASEEPSAAESQDTNVSIRRERSRRVALGYSLLGLACSSQCSERSAL